MARSNELVVGLVVGLLGVALAVVSGDTSAHPRANFKGTRYENRNVQPQASRIRNVESQASGVRNVEPQASGSSPDSEVEYVDGPLAPLYDFLIEHKLQRFCKLLRDAGLEQEIQSLGASWTLFAPNDASFIFLPGGTLEELQRNPRLIRDFILYHFVVGDFPSSQIQNELLVDSVQGSPLRFNTYGQVSTVSGAEILQPDLLFEMGRVYIIDRPLYPLPTEDILTYLQRNHREMYKLIVDLGLVDYLSSGTFTFLAPDDQAFDYLSAELKDALATNISLAERILFNHILPGSVYVGGITDGSQWKTIGDTYLIFTLKRGLTFANDIPIVLPDVNVNNGVIHVLNRVLLPEGIDADCQCKPNKQPSPGSPSPGQPQRPPYGQGATTRRPGQPVPVQTPRPVGSQIPGQRGSDTRPQTPGSSAQTGNRPWSPSRTGQPIRPVPPPSRITSPPETPSDDEINSVVDTGNQPDRGQKRPDQTRTTRYPPPPPPRGRPTPRPQQVVPSRSTQRPYPGSENENYPEQEITPGAPQTTRQTNRWSDSQRTPAPRYPTPPRGPYNTPTTRRPQTTRRYDWDQPRVTQPSIKQPDQGAGVDSSTLNPDQGIQTQRPISQTTSWQQRNQITQPTRRPTQRPTFQTTRQTQAPQRRTTTQRPSFGRTTLQPQVPTNEQPFEPSRQQPNCRRKGDILTSINRNLPLCSESSLDGCQNPPFNPSDARPLCPDNEISECRNPNDPYNPSDNRPLCPAPVPAENCRQPGQPTYTGDRRPLCSPTTSPESGCKDPSAPYNPSDNRPLCPAPVPAENCRQPGQPTYAGDRRPLCSPTTSPQTGCKDPSAPYNPSDNRPLCPAPVPAENCRQPGQPTYTGDRRPLCSPTTSSQTGCKDPSAPYNPSDRRPVCPAPVPAENCRQPDQPTYTGDRRPLCSPTTSPESGCKDPSAPYNPSDNRPLCPAPVPAENCRQPGQPTYAGDRRPLCSPTTSPQTGCKDPSAPYNPSDNRPLCPAPVPAENCRQPGQPTYTGDRRPLCSPTTSPQTGCKDPSAPYNPSDRRPVCRTTSAPITIVPSTESDKIQQGCRRPNEVANPQDRRPLCPIESEQDCRPLLARPQPGDRRPVCKVSQSNQIPKPPKDESSQKKPETSPQQTTRPQPPPQTTRRQSWQSTTRAPQSWQTTRSQSLQSTTRAPQSWQTTRRQSWQSTTRAPQSWQTTRQPVGKQPQTAGVSQTSPPSGINPSQPQSGIYPQQPGSQPSQPQTGDTPQSQTGADVQPETELNPSQPQSGIHSSQKQPQSGRYPSQQQTGRYPTAPQSGAYPSQPQTGSRPFQPQPRPDYPSPHGSPPSGSYPNQVPPSGSQTSDPPSVSQPHSNRYPSQQPGRPQSGSHTSQPHSGRYPSQQPGRPQPGSQTSQPQSGSYPPSQTGITPGTSSGPSQPPSGSYPSQQPGSPHTGSYPSQPGSVGGRPGQPGSVEIQPGQPGSVDIQPGQPGSFGTRPGQPGSVNTRPGQPGSVSTRPGQPGSAGIRPGQPGSVVFQPGQQGSVGSRPGQPFNPRVPTSGQPGTPAPAPLPPRRTTSTTRVPISVTGTSSTPSEDSRRTLYEIVEDPALLIRGRPVQLTRIFELFHKAGIEDILTGPGPTTVFLPSDDAFALLPQGVIEQLEENPELLRQVLLFHVTQSEILPSAQPESFSVPSLEGNQLLVTMLNGGRLILISGAKAVAVTRANNGIFYVINQLLYPLPHHDIVGAIQTRPDLTTLAYLLPLSGLEDMLRGQTPYTLLAPTDNAFAQLPQAVYDELTRNTTALQEILLNHIIEGAHYGREFFTGGTFPSARGGKLKFQVVSYGYQVNDINIKTPEIVTGTGVIHLIDQVLLEDPDLQFVTNLENALAGLTGDDGSLTNPQQPGVGNQQPVQPQTNPGDRRPVSGQRIGVQPPSAHQPQIGGLQPSGRQPAPVGRLPVSGGPGVPATSGQSPNFGGQRQPSVGNAGQQTPGHSTDYRGRQPSTQGVRQPIQAQFQPGRQPLPQPGQGQPGHSPFGGPGPSAPGHSPQTGAVTSQRQPAIQTGGPSAAGGYPGTSQSGGQPNDVADLARSMGLNQFANWITNTGLLEKVHDGGVYTVFAPTDDAVSSLPQDMVYSIQSNPEQVKPILEYHIVPQRLNLNSVTNEETASTLLKGKTIRFNVYQNSQPDCKQLVTASGTPVGEALATMGSIQVIPVTQVLYQPAGNLQKIIEASPILQQLSEAVKSASLTWILSGTGPMTIFAPSDTAFDSLTEEQRKTLVEDKQAFSDLLKRHIIRGTFFSSGIQDDVEKKSENYKPIKLSLQEGVLTVNSVPVTYSDITATNGVLHVIDQFL